MKRNSRPILIGAFVLVLLNSGCGAFARANPTPVWTVPVTDQSTEPVTTLEATATTTEVPVTPVIPITGEDVVSMQCQFCVDAETHTILIFPDFAYFDVSSESPASCLTAAVVNGKRILICHGAPSTTFNLNICSDPDNCLQYPVALQPCPLLQAGATPLVTNTPFTPVFLTPINTLKPPTDGPTQPASTPIPSSTPTGSFPAAPTTAVTTPTSSVILPTVPLPTSIPTLISTLLPQETPASPTPSNSDATSTPGPSAPTQESGTTTLVICHVSPGNSGERKTMTINQTDWDGHRKHGDTLGPCS